MPFIPDQNQKDWMIAQNYLLKTDKLEISENLDDEGRKEEEKVFKKIVNKINNHVHISNLTESYIYEKSYEIDKVKILKIILDSSISKIFFYF